MSMAQVINYLISNDTRGAFEETFTEAEKIRVLDTLQTWITLLQNANTDQRRKLGINFGIIKPDETNSARINLSIGLLLDKCYWQMAQLLRWCCPTRISEAEPYLRPVLREYDNVHHGAKKDVIPMLYLAVSLHRDETKEDEALAIFRDAFRYYDLGSLDLMSNVGPKSELWARAAMSRLLRKKGLVSEAKEHEKLAREYIIDHPYMMRPSAFRSLVIDETWPNAVDHIFGHPHVRRLFTNAVELPVGPDGMHAVMFADMFPC